MEQKAYDVEMMYIQNTSGNDYTVELTGRRCPTLRLNFSGVDGVEFNAVPPLQVTQSYLQMADGQDKLLSLKFQFPTNLNVKAALDKIVIEVI